MRNRIWSYFSLARPVLGHSTVERQLILFTGVVAGSIGQWAFASIQNDQFAPANLLLGLIASIVTFPAIFYNAGLDKVDVTFVKWCVAFQNGFFWPALLEQISKGFNG